MKFMKIKLTNVIVLAIFAIMIVYSCIRFNRNEVYLKEAGIMIIGKITGDKLTKNNFFITYSFKYNQKNHNDLKTASNIQIGDVPKFLINKSFPLILSKEDPENNALLIFREDFERYNLVYPDSLKWVCDSLKLKDCN